MIIVGKQFKLKVLLGDEDIITLENFRTIEVTELAGNILPSVKLVMSVKSEDILLRCNEGNTFGITLGSDEDQLLDIKFRIVSTNYLKESKDSGSLTIIGIYDCLGYLNDSAVSVFGPCSSVEAIKSVISPYLRDKIDVKTTSDVMCWYQGGRTVRTFVRDIWEHMNLGKDFPLLAITFGGFLKVRSYENLKNNSNMEILSDIGGDVPILNMDVATQDSVLANSWYGYGRKKSIYNMDTGEVNTYEYSSDLNLALSKSLLRDPKVKSRMEPMGIKNSNVYEGFEEAKMRNVQNLTLLSVSSLDVSIEYSTKIEVLDSVMLLVRALSSINQFSEPLSGKYIVMKRVRKITNEDISDILSLSRQSMSSVKGDLR